MNTSHCSHSISRRGFAGLLGASAGLSLLSFRAAAADPTKPTTLCITCIDYRFVKAAVNYCEANVGNKNYDIVALAGGSLAAKLTSFPGIFAGLWEETTVATLLHPAIKNVIVFDHRDCGAFNNVYGAETGTDEENRHRTVAREVQPFFVARGLKSQFRLLNTPDDINPTLLTRCDALPQCPQS